MSLAAKPFSAWLPGALKIQPDVWQEVHSSVARRARGGSAAYEHALVIGASAEAHVGLALLAREEGRPDDTERHLAAARAAEPELPALKPPSATPAAFSGR